MADNIVLVTWAEPSRAYKALTDLRNSGGKFNIQQVAILERKADGTFAVKDGNNDAVGLGTLGGGVVGMLVGLLGGPLGVLLGWAGGSLFGSLADMSTAADSASVLVSMSKFVSPGNTALVLELDEADESALDAFVAESGGIALRRSAADVRAEVAAAVQAADAAAAEASRVLHKQRVAEGKEKVEHAWDDLKAKFKKAFS